MSLLFPSWDIQINYKLYNAQWSDEYSVHNINPDINLMCELNVAVELFTTVCSLFDADSISYEYFFVHNA